MQDRQSAVTAVLGNAHAFEEFGKYRHCGRNAGCGMRLKCDNFHENLIEMMPAEIFRLSNSVALLTWIALLLFPFQRIVHQIILGIIVTGFCMLYALIVLPGLGSSDLSSFGSLAGVMQLFTSEEAVLAGWIHYLAFDLMTGLFIVNNALKYGISRLLLLPCLFFTFMLGPVGLLMYLLIRSVKMKKYFLQ